MTRALVNRHCATLPGAAVSDPWGGGHDAWKVGGKLFAVVGAMEDHGVAVKCPDVETAQLLIEMGRALRAPYFHASWVRIPWGLVPEDELTERLSASSRIIRASLPRRCRRRWGSTGKAGRAAERPGKFPDLRADRAAPPCPGLFLLHDAFGKGGIRGTG